MLAVGEEQLRLGALVIPPHLEGAAEVHVSGRLPDDPDVLERDFLAELRGEGLRGGVPIADPPQERLPGGILTLRTGPRQRKQEKDAGEQERARGTRITD
jgi:hypothetical protein